MKACHRVSPIFDDPNLVSTAGLVPVLRLAETAGLHEELAGLTVPSPNAAAKTVCVIGGMLAGADSHRRPGRPPSRRDASVLLRGTRSLDDGHAPARVHPRARAATCQAPGLMEAVLSRSDGCRGGR